MDKQKLDAIELALSSAERSMAEIQAILTGQFQAWKECNSNAREALDSLKQDVPLPYHSGPPNETMLNDKDLLPKPNKALGQLERLSNLLDEIDIAPSVEVAARKANDASIYIDKTIMGDAPSKKDDIAAAVMEVWDWCDNAFNVGPHRREYFRINLMEALSKI